MIYFNKSLFVFLIIIISCCGNVFSQIIINGPKPPSLYNGGGGNLELSLSYGYNFWKDSKQKELKGYSASLSDYAIINDIISFDKFDFSKGLFFGIESHLTESFSIKANLFHAKLETGLSTRSDLEIVNDKSKFSQLAVYSSLILTKDKDRRLLFHWLIGPEIIYVQKNMIIKDYQENANAATVDYHYKESIIEIGLVTGLGASVRVTDKFSVFADGLFGLSLPGKGLKITSHNIGLKYKVN